MDACAVWLESFSHGISHSLCGFTFYLVYLGETGFAPNQTDHGLSVVFTDDGIGFPVTHPTAFFYYGQRCSMDCRLGMMPRRPFCHAPFDCGANHQAARSEYAGNPCPVETLFWRR